MKRLYEKIPIRFRLSFLLVGLMTGTLLVASAAGFFPNEQREVLRGRAKLCEALAISGTAMTSSGNTSNIDVTLQSIVNRDDQVVSIGFRLRNGELMVSAGPHSQIWDPDLTNSAEQMTVPIFRNGNSYGSLEVAFVSTGGFLGLNHWAPAWLLIILIPGCLFQFSFFLRRALDLDPDGAMPKRVRDTFDQLAVGVLVTDERDRILLVNRLFTETIGLDADKAFGMKASSIQWIRDDESKELPWVESSQTGEMVSGRILRLDLPDRRLTFSVNSTPIVGCCVMVILEDITELEENKLELAKAKDAAEHASQSKSTFLANMSHEIRTPMNAILGFTEVLRRNIERDETKRKRHLNTIHSSGTHLLNLINDVLDLSKVEADRLEVEAIPCAVQCVIADVVTFMNVRAEEKGITLDFAFDGKIPASITSDPARLRQIITNLVGNAIKFTDRGGVKIVTRLETRLDRPQMMIQVVDTGVGMSPEATEKIFDPFSQADASVARRFGGTGLGLSISKRFAEALGGGIRVISEEGIGSVFVATIDTGPLDGVAMIEPTKAELEMLSADEQHLEIRLPNMSVLLVDDGEENRDLMSVILEEAGATYATAENGLEAVNLAIAEDWDVILMDMNMPVMDGYTATRKLRERGYNKPIIALTAHAMQQAEQECRDAGCSGFLTKPVDFDKLITTLAEIAGCDVTVSKRQTNDEHPTVNAVSIDPNENLPAHVHSSLDTGNPKFRAIVNRFILRLPQQLSEMDQALQDRDFDQLADLAHWLKGSGPNVGFADFGELARQLEECASGSDGEGAEQLLTTIRSLCERIDVEQITSGCIESEANPLLEEHDSPTEPRPLAHVAGGAIVSSLPMNKERFQAIVVQFVKRLESRFDTIQQAIEAGDSAELADLGHWLKGASANCGFASIAEIASGLETSGRSGDTDGAAEILNQLRDMHSRIELPQVGLRPLEELQADAS